MKLSPFLIGSFLLLFSNLAWAGSEEERIYDPYGQLVERLGLQGGRIERLYDAKQRLHAAIYISNEGSKQEIHFRLNQNQIFEGQDEFGRTLFSMNELGMKADLNHDGRFERYFLHYGGLAEPFAISDEFGQFVEKQSPDFFFHSPYFENASGQPLSRSQFPIWPMGNGYFLGANDDLLFRGNGNYFDPEFSRAAAAATAPNAWGFAPRLGPLRYEGCNAPWGCRSACWPGGPFCGEAGIDSEMGPFFMGAGVLANTLRGVPLAHAVAEEVVEEVTGNVANELGLPFAPRLSFKRVSAPTADKLNFFRQFKGENAAELERALDEFNSALPSTEDILAARAKHAELVNALKKGPVELPRGQGSVQHIAEVCRASAMDKDIRDFREIGVARNLKDGKRYMLLGDEDGVQYPPGFKSFAHTHPNEPLILSWGEGGDSRHLFYTGFYDRGRPRRSHLLIGPAAGRSRRVDFYRDSLPSELNFIRLRFDEMKQRRVGAGADPGDFSFGG